METKLNNTWQTEIKMYQKGKNIIMPQGWACSDRTCKHNKNSNEMTNSKQVFSSSVCCTRTAEHPTQPLCLLMEIFFQS